jgi:UDP-glucuronate decarboxylase
VDSDEVQVTDHDIKDPFPDFEAVDEIYHFASRASPMEFESHGIDIALTNAEGTKHALDCAVDHQATLLLASTSEVYGDPEVHPQDEEYNGNVNVRGVRSPYDEGKRYAEALAYTYYREKGLDVRTARIFNTYGPRMRKDDGRVVPNFVTQSLSDGDITVHGDGSQTRTFCYYSDMIRGIRALMTADRARMAGNVVNLGGTREIEIFELAKLVTSVVDTGSDITFTERPEDDPEVRLPDIERARELLDWEPRIDLRDGIERTVDWFEANVNREVS